MNKNPCSVLPNSQTRTSFKNMMYGLYPNDITKEINKTIGNEIFHEQVETKYAYT